MGKYDNYDRDYFGERERFAELFTYGLFSGRLVVDSSNLSLGESRYQSLRTASGTIQRDVKYFSGELKAYLALEIENKVDYRMPERFLLYDASEYEKQMKKIIEQKEQAGTIKTYNDIKQVVEEEEDMCKAIRDLIRDERQAGIEQGELNTLKNNIRKLMDNANFDFEACVRILDVKEDTAMKIKQMLY